MNLFINVVLMLVPTWILLLIAWRSWSKKPALRNKCFAAAFAWSVLVLTPVIQLSR